MRPIWIQQYNGEWNLGSSLDGEECLDITSVEWIKRLVNGKYTHVAIIRPGKDFVERYGTIFEDPSLIGNNTLFYFDTENRKLVLCEE